MAFSLGLMANGLSLLLTRAFFSLQRPDIPTRVAAVNLVLNAVLDIALLGYGAAGIALSTSIVTIFNATVLAIALRTRVGSLHGREVRRHTGCASPWPPSTAPWRRSACGGRSTSSWGARSPPRS